MRIRADFFVMNERQNIFHFHFSFFIDVFTPYFSAKLAPFKIFCNHIII